ncbi:hypothetical protein AXA74_00515 [Bordetella hinzii LMG 13501]|nr:hypothetical protein AXA74_00515 [Bordetella hinzii LMG 13501]
MIAPEHQRGDVEAGERGFEAGVVEAAAQPGGGGAIALLQGALGIVHGLGQDAIGHALVEVELAHERFFAGGRGRGHPGPQSGRADQGQAADMLRVQRGQLGRQPTAE